MTDSTRRSIRTGIDLLLSVLGALAAMLLVPGFAEVLDGMTAAGATATIGIVVAALAVFLTKLRNALEDRGSIPAVLKAPASDGADPTPDPGPLPDGTRVRHTTELVSDDDEQPRRH